jgi:hypothetical protein
VKNGVDIQGHYNWGDNASITEVMLKDSQTV